MKTIKIAHLYYDIMNLYGENGNVKYLAHKLEEQNFKVDIHFLTIDDRIDFNKYDIFYIGTGNEESITYVLEDLQKYKQDIKQAINNNKYFILTGNALELFAKKIIKNKKRLKSINVLDYIVTYEDFRIVGEQYYESPLIEQKIIGFQNRSSTIFYEKESLFKVIKGTGYNPKAKTEGITKKNVFATYLLGPFLVRNPYFTDYLVQKICTEQNQKYTLPNYTDPAYKAYHEYIKNFHSK